MQNSVTNQTRSESFKSTDKKSRQKIILNALGNSKFTARQIANKLGYKDLNYVKPRITELLHEGTIIAKDKAFDPTTNRNVAVYQLNSNISKNTSTRKSFEEINEIKKKYKIKTLWSWSRYKTYENDPFTYYLRYVKGIAPDRTDSIYSPMGTAAHEILQMYYEGNINQDEMVEKYKEKIYEFSLFNYKFDRTNEEKNKTISHKYEKNLLHFFINHKKPEFKAALEEFLLVKITPGIYFQGYADCIHTTQSENGTEVWITDFKTSSLYRGEALREMSRQLLLYAMGVHQKTGIPYERIHIQFHFLKYVRCTIKKLNGKRTNTTLQRYNYIEFLSKALEMWLKNSKEQLDDLTINLLIDKAIKQNNFGEIPEDVKNKFFIDDCIVEIPYSESDIKNLTDNIIKVISEIQDKTNKYEASGCKDEKDIELFWQNATDKNSYFMANLSDYSAKIHKPYQEYLSKKGVSHV